MRAASSIRDLVNCIVKMKVVVASSDVGLVIKKKDWKDRKVKRNVRFERKESD